MKEELDDRTVLDEEGTQPHEQTQPVSALDGIYERLPDISVKSLDRFILICVIALVAVVVIGVLRANHII